MGDLKCRELKIGFCRKRCKSVILRLALAGNLEKPLMYLYGTEWRERDTYCDTYCCVSCLLKYTVQLQPIALLLIGHYTHGTSILSTKLKSESASLLFNFIIFIFATIAVSQGK
jgi:hypothetical protein